MRVLESVLYAEDLVAARQFYVDILALEEIMFDENRDLFLRCEGSVVILFKASKTIVADSGVPAHGTVGAGHLAFAASQKEIETWRAHLNKNGVDIVEEINWKNGAKSIYFKDPAGNIIEFATPSLWDFEN
jgi:catechol 2,3-dioxygenase-like lactoylglutathione lyase family enzyme